MIELFLNPHPQLESFIALNEYYMLMWKTHRIMAWKQ